MMASNSSTWSRSALGSSVFHSGLTTGGFAGFFRKLGGMVFDVEPVVLPSRNVGGEFIGKVPIAGLLSKLDAGAPYNG
jgi:hypothetical protein